MASPYPAYADDLQGPKAPPALDTFEGLGHALSDLRTLTRGSQAVVVGIVDGPVATDIPALRDTVRVAHGRPGTWPAES